MRVQKVKTPKPGVFVSLEQTLETTPESKRETARMSRHLRSLGCEFKARLERSAPGCFGGVFANFSPIDQRKWELRSRVGNMLIRIGSRLAGYVLIEGTGVLIEGTGGETDEDN